MAEISAAASGEFRIGGDLPVHRVGYGTMRLVGEGAWGEPGMLMLRGGCCGARWSWA